MTDTTHGAMTASEGLTPPQALEAERSVLAALLLDHESVGLAIEMIDASAFYRVSHQKIYEAILALYNRNEKADLITLTEEMRKRGDLEAVGGSPAIAQILEYATTSANVEQYIRIIHSKSVLRKLIKAANEIQQEAFAGSEDTPLILDRAEERIFAITDERVREGFIHIRDLLKPAFEHIQGLFERKVLITGVPSGYDDLDKFTAGFQKSDLVIIAGRPAMGKCLTGDTLIDDPDTGARKTIEAYVRARNRNVLGISSTGRVRVTRVSDWVDSGVQPCFRVATRTGRSIEVTGHHPFLTVEGWHPVSDLRAGNRIAIPRECPVFGSDDSWSLGRTRLLAYFIAEGGLSGTCPYFTNVDPVLIDDFTTSLSSEFPSCGARDVGDGITWRVARRAGCRAGKPLDGQPLNPVTRWLTDLDLMGKKSDAKRFPECVWRWPRTHLVEFVRVLFSCDGTVYSMGGYPRIEFTVASEALAQDVHHALCRLGIIAKLWRKTERSWRVETTEAESAQRYQREIGWLGEKATRTFAGEIAGRQRLPHTNVGHAPNEAWAIVRGAAERGGIGLMEMARRAGEPAERGYNLHTRRGIPRARLAGYAAVLEDPTLERASSPDLYWDEIVSIEPTGEHQVYDLTVPDGANFIANDICVHNTSFAMNIAENAAIRAKIPAAIFSLEMSKEQLVQRLLCSQGGVALHRVRNGSLANEDWPRLTTAAGLLTQAPIMIDDSANVSLMEIRAKCRRLSAENRLGLVVIDYLQLIRPSGNSENRVQEISQITRGLKALAKELRVPVIALSQLSRAVETRDKSGRPQLSDLRESGCLTRDTRILRADTGSEVTLGELLDRGERDIPVWTVDSAMKIVRGTMTHVFPSGTKQVFELVLASGRRVTASGNHPFLTLDGWRALERLSIGVRLATLPEVGEGGGYTLLSAMDQESRAASTTAVMEAPAPARLDASDVFWDTIVSIEPLGEQPVFDATVPGTQNFVANGIVAHNSIEQDADIVMFVYREEVYKPDTAEKGKAQIIIAKQRNGPTADVALTFLRESTKFVPYSPMMPDETEPGF